MKVVFIDGVPCEFEAVAKAFNSLPSRYKKTLGKSLESFCMKNRYLIASDNGLSIFEYCWSSGLPAPRGVHSVREFKEYLGNLGVVFYDVVDSESAVRCHCAVECIQASDGALLVEVPQCSDLHYFRRD